MPSGPPANEAGASTVFPAAITSSSSSASPATFPSRAIAVTSSPAPSAPSCACSASPPGNCDSQQGKDCQTIVTLSDNCLPRQLGRVTSDERQVGGAPCGRTNRGRGSGGMCGEGIYKNGPNAAARTRRAWRGEGINIEKRENRFVDGNAWRADGGRQLGQLGTTFCKMRCLNGRRVENAWDAGGGKR